MSMHPYFREYASQQQIGEAAELRYGPGSAAMPHDVRQSLNQIVHSGDVRGPFSQTYNPYRGMPGQYDPAAEAALRLARPYGR